MTELSTHDLRIEIGDVVVCRDFCTTFLPGQVWTILGPNGVGKSTLLRTLAGLYQPIAGQVSFDGQPLADIPRRKRARQIGILFQDHADVFPLTVMETVLTGRHPWCSPLQGESALDLERVDQVLGQVGLNGFQDRNLFSLSGGERRRVDLAASAVQDSAVVLLDEPSNHLDPRHQVTLLGGMIDEWRRARRTVVMVLHDINLAVRFSDYLVFLYGDGKASHGLVAEMATEGHFSRLYDQPMGRYQANDRDLFFPL